MDKTQFYNLLKNPELLKQTDRIAIERLVKEYPWFQSAQLLLIKKYQLDNHPDFELKLNNAAAHLPNREILFQIMNGQSGSSISELSEKDVTEKIEIIATDLQPKEIIINTEKPTIPVDNKSKQKTEMAEPKSEPSSTSLSEAANAFNERKSIEAGNSELNEMLRQMRENRRKILGDEPSLTKDNNQSKIADPNAELLAASYGNAEFSVDEHNDTTEHDEVIDEHTATESEAITSIENEIIAEEIQTQQAEFRQLIEHGGDSEVSPDNYLVEEENEFGDEEKEDYETLGILQLEDEIILIEEDIIAKSQEVSLLSVSELNSKAGIDEENEFSAEENEAYETLGLINVENEIEIIEEDLLSKTNEINSLSHSELNHKNELIEPDDERLFEEKFDTEIEMLKKIEQQTSEIKNTQISESENLLESEFIELEPVFENTEKPREDFLNQSHSFVDWLQFFNKPALPASSPIVINQELSEISTEPEAQIHEFTPDILTNEPAEDLTVIDNFVKSLSNKKEDETDNINAIELAKKSLELNEAIVSETLAKIYESQNRLQKAIDMYEKLRLKFPEKSPYFADLIKNLKNKI